MEQRADQDKQLHALQQQIATASREQAGATEARMKAEQQVLLADLMPACSWLAGLTQFSWTVTQSTHTSSTHDSSTCWFMTLSHIGHVIHKLLTVHVDL